MSQNTFSESFNSILSGIDRYVSSRTVVGEAIMLNERTVIVPMVDVSFGAASGTFADKGNSKGRVGGGLAGKVSPCAVLVMQGDLVRILPVKNRDTLDRIMDLVPEIINKFRSRGKEGEDEAIIHEAFESAGESVE
ncbi:MAG: GerW family sporulation protein [Lachnospiraceae bacterium]|nr:GerW family sporulation protein [Lachnospiraceae bacterium]MBR2738899.1 GerW family sporulation protein [Lachnospiraceae bacterium]MCR5538110.1 GerW family sporulation protein [Lachnospiraceae bacterium]